MRFRLEFISLEVVKPDAFVPRVLCLNLSQVSDEHKFFLLGDVQRPCTKWFWQAGRAGALNKPAMTGSTGVSHSHTGMCCWKSSRCFSCCCWCFPGSGLSPEGTVTPALPCICFFSWIFAFGKNSPGNTTCCEVRHVSLCYCPGFLSVCSVGNAPVPALHFSDLENLCLSLKKCRMYFA